MKKHLFICIALVAVMASCVKEPIINRRLTPEEAAVIPYGMGEKISMINQDGDVLCFTVINDTTEVAYSYEENLYNPHVKVLIPTNPDFYMREVVLQEANSNTLLRCKVGYDKVVKLSLETHPEGTWTGYWELVMGGTLNLKQLSTQTVTVGGMTYENAYYDEQMIAIDSFELPFSCYYSEEYGLISMKYGQLALQRIP